MTDVSTPEPTPTWTEVLLDEPFRLFFPLGVLATLSGMVPWVLLALGRATTYPGREHGLLQIQGFEMAFAVGFLMTAVPRFLEVPGTRAWELALGLALSAGTTVALVLAEVRMAQWLFLGLAVHLAMFALRRRRGRGDDPPPFFAFLPIGFVSAIAGSALILWPLERLPRLGELLVEQGMLLCFVLAIGSHLGPRLLYGHRGFPETTTPEAHRRLALLAGVGLLLLASFPVEAAGYPTVGIALRATIVTGYLFGVLRVYRRPHQPRVHLYLMRLAFWCVPAGLWLMLAPGKPIDSLHLTLAGGFGVLTFVVATRVILGHAGFDELWARDSVRINLPLSMITLSVPMRLTAAAVPEHATMLAAFAGLLWIVGVGLWAIVLLPKVAPWHVAPD